MLIRNEKTSLLAAAEEGIKSGNSDLLHLSNMAAIYNYVRIADEIAKVMKKGKILDWGCGYGHMSFLLQNRRLDVASYEVQKRENIEKLAIFKDIKISYTFEKDILPFEDASYDAVLSCGTLEHVPDVDKSMKELSRILKKDGYLFVYMLPNEYSYTEYISRLRGIDVHPVKYVSKQIQDLFRKNGFTIEKIKRSNMLPKNLTGFPGIIKYIYGITAPFVVTLDKFLSNMPILNIISGVWEIKAVKR